MKIKRQVFLFSLLVIVLSIPGVLGFPLYVYFTSPRHYFSRSYRQLNEVDWDDARDVRNVLSVIPPEVQICILDDSQVLASSIPGIERGAVFTPDDVFALISMTGSDYDYRVQTVKEDGNGDGFPGLIISRSSVGLQNTLRANTRYITFFLLAIAAVDIAAIMIMIKEMKSVTNSIVNLQSATRKISSGELETKIINPKKGSPNELWGLAEDLENMRSTLQDARDRRARFIMGVSHDLKTPVSVIKGYAEAVTDGIMTSHEDIQRSAGIIDRRSEQLESMINSLIDYIKLTSSEWKKTQEEIHIKPFLEGFARDAAEAGELYNRKIIIDIDIEDRLVVMDKALVSRALENIFGNALRYTAEGGTITVFARQSAGGAIRLDIRDTGQGIPQESLEHVFDLFYRGTPSRREEGMGIGLSVVKSVIDSHGWDIQVESEAGKGTVFSIYIP